MLKEELKSKIAKYAEGVGFDILISPSPELGDYSTNVAFVLAKRDKKKPADMAAEIREKLGKDLGEIAKVSATANGFINFHLKEEFLRENLEKILNSKDRYFISDLGKDKKINLEFVSANPTGPMTVHNARAASYGDTLGNIFKIAGFKVVKEYYVNDIGGQVQRLGESVAKRILEIWGETAEFGEELYQGRYIIDIAQEMHDKKIVEPGAKFENLVKPCRDYAASRMVAGAKKSMVDLGVDFNVWFSEKSLHDSGEVTQALDILKEKGKVYQKDNAWWLKVDSADPEKDAVVVKSDGSTTYLMNDIAYTLNKLKLRAPPAGGPADKAINIWGADHHGDVHRLKAGVEAVGLDPERLEILLHQLVMVKKDDVARRMSKRRGEFVMLGDLLNEVGKDAIRYFFLTKDLNTHMEFDVDLAKEQSKKNPVFYIQYAVARLSSIFQKAGEKKAGDSSLLTAPEEINLMRLFIRLPDLLADISENYQVHHLAQYAYELANAFHKWYEKNRIIQENTALQNARLSLAQAVHNGLSICLNLMGISAPEKM